MISKFHRTKIPFRRDKSKKLHLGRVQALVQPAERHMAGFRVMLTTPIVRDIAPFLILLLMHGFFSFLFIKLSPCSTPVYFTYLHPSSVLCTSVKLYHDIAFRHMCKYPACLWDLLGPTRTALHSTVTDFSSTSMQWSQCCTGHHLVHCSVTLAPPTCGCFPSNAGPIFQ